MREIAASQITDTVAQLCMQAAYCLPDDVVAALRAGVEREQSPRGKAILRLLLENADAACGERTPLCQDTGLAVVFADVGQEARIIGDLDEAIHAGVRRGYTEGYLRASVVAHPLARTNTGDNAPAVVHTRLVAGDKVHLFVAPKGAGSENMSALRMLKPADGVEGIRRLVLETVEQAGPSACPPLIVGVGLGGTMEMAALLAKRALLRRVGQASADKTTAALERDLLGRVNATGIGPSGLGGTFTAMAVHVETYPCHIASLPVAVNLQCHAARHAEAEL